MEIFQLSGNPSPLDFVNHHQVYEVLFEEGLKLEGSSVSIDVGET